MSGTVVLYGAVGDVLTLYEIDRARASLTRRAEFRMPNRVQYAWRHPALPVLYVTTASSGPRTHSRDNQVTAFRIDEAGGCASSARRAAWPPGRFISASIRGGSSSSTRTTSRDRG